MNLDRNIENLLTRLGEAHKAGAVGSDAVRYPWQAKTAPVSEQVSYRWVRVAVPVAAAAAVAFLLMGPKINKSNSRTPEVADSTRSILPAKSTVAPAALSTPTSVQYVDCDYNGDGVVDGLDIQAFVNHLQENAGDPQIAAEYLQRCLLGS